MILDVNQLAQELQLQPGTLRSWLGNYRFSKDIVSTRPITFNVTKDFLTCLETYLTLKKPNSKIKHTIHNLKWLRSRVYE